MAIFILTPLKGQEWRGSRGGRDAMKTIIGVYSKQSTFLCYLTTTIGLCGNSSPPSPLSQIWCATGFGFWYN